MEINYDNIKTGWPSEVFPNLRRRVSQYRRSSASFKIGFTSNPTRRATAYSSEYDQMVLLYQTSSSHFVKTMEAALINHYMEDCDNSIGGGGGPSAKPPFYLYIVRRN